eukprot:3154470-Prymnesium_polylepis.1
MRKCEERHRGLGPIGLTGCHKCSARAALCVDVSAEARMSCLHLGRQSRIGSAGSPLAAVGPGSRSTRCRS